MNKLENHVKKVSKTKEDVSVTLGSLANVILDLKKHGEDVAKQKSENTRMIEELQNANKTLDATGAEIASTVEHLEKLSKGAN